MFTGINLGCVVEMEPTRFKARSEPSLKSGANTGFPSWPESTWDADPTRALTYIERYNPVM